MISLGAPVTNGLSLAATLKPGRPGRPGPGGGLPTGVVESSTETDKGQTESAAMVLLQSPSRIL
jgi:hypothetical protein